MRVEVKMPNLGYDMEVGTIASWIASVGDTVERGQPIAEVETDKTTLELESPRSGTLVEVVHQQGAEVEVGEVIGYLEVEE